MPQPQLLESRGDVIQAQGHLAQPHSLQALTRLLQAVFFSASTEEGMTLFFNCTACGHRWRDSV